MQGFRRNGYFRTMAAAAAVVAALHLAPFALAKGTGQDALADRAAGLAEAATKEFSVILERQRLAQADPKKGVPTATKRDDSSTSPLSWLWHSSQQFRALMGMLAGSSVRTQPWDPVAEAEKKAGLSQSSAKKSEGERPAQSPPAKQIPPKVEAAATEVGGAKKPGEERKLAEARRAEADKRVADAAKPEGAPKAEQGKRPAAPANRPDEPAKADAGQKADGPKAVSEAEKAAAEAKKVEAEKQAKAVAEAKKAEAEKQAKAEAEAKKAEAEKQAKAEAEAKKAEAEKQARAEAEAKKAEADKQAKAAKEAAEAKKLADANAAKLAKPERSPVSPADQPKEVNALCPQAGTAASLPGWYVVQSGDTLSEISQRHYGRALRYEAIHAANRSRIANPNRIYACQRIYLPQLRM